jgi:hypothetical protein
MSLLNQASQAGSNAAGAPLWREGSPGGIRMDGSFTGPGQGGEAHAAPSEELHFKVRYALPEYVSFMWQHAGYLIRRRRIGKLATWWMLSKSTSAAAMHFVAQGRSRHLYDFLVDVHGIVRTSGTGVTLVPWTDVIAIRRYTNGYMMVLKRGTLPVPFRCLDTAQARLMDVFAATVKASRHA